MTETENVKFDVNRLTIGELAKVEELAHMGIGTLDDPAAPKASLFAALYFVWARRSDKTLTWGQANATSFGDLQAALGMDDDDDDADDAEVDVDAATQSGDSNFRPWFVPDDSEE